MLSSSSVRRIERCYTSRNELLMAFKPLKTRRKSSTKSPSSTRLRVPEACGGMIRPLQLSGHRLSVLLLNAMPHTQIFLSKGGMPMKRPDLEQSFNANTVGQDMYRLITELYPICRSITGNGFRESLHLIKRQIPLEIHEVATGTPVFDWTVPREWNIRDAYIKNSRGERVVDFRQSNLHVLNYSIPVKKKVSLSELKEHVFTLPEHPEWIPYRTSYYQERWGFCLSHRQLLALTEDEYEVCIDSSLEPGHLTYGE